MILLNNHAQVIETIAKLLPQAELKEEHHTQLQYQLPTSETRLPVVFRYAVFQYGDSVIFLLVSDTWKISEAWGQ